MDKTRRKTTSKPAPVVISQAALRWVAAAAARGYAAGTSRRDLAKLLEGLSAQLRLVAAACASIPGNPPADAVEATALRVLLGDFRLADVPLGARCRVVVRAEVAELEVVGRTSRPHPAVRARLVDGTTVESFPADTPVLGLL